MNHELYAEKKGIKTSICSVRRAKLSRRRPFNRHEAEATDDLNASTSAKKLKRSEDLYDIEVNPAFGYRIINLITVFSAISDVVVCKICQSKIKFTESSKRGLGFKLVVSCEKCEKTEIPSCPLVQKGYEINRRIIIAMRLLGVGWHGIRKFCAFMELPRAAYRSFYDKVVKRMNTATNLVCQNSMMRAAEEEKTISIEDGEQGIVVSGDGSWRKRGFTSLYGLVTLIGYNCGKIVDCVVKSKYCKACEYWSNKKNTDEYAEWAESHVGECAVNHYGSAGKMEVDAVVEMFRRSKTLHQVIYSYYIGDGDSKTFKGITDAKPYEDLTVVKKECIDHVQKRMGTRLRNLKKKTKSLGGRGKLTGKLIDELTIYYGLAIRRNSDSVENMRSSIWATLDHKLSTDAKPQHDKCPIGEDSWCSWQRAKATNTLAECKHKPALSIEVYEAFKPIYEELTNQDLLTRCIGGYTQNNNESFNSTVWALAPKYRSSGKTVLDVATEIGVCIFNDGVSSILHIMKAMDLEIGPNSYEMCMEIDKQRIKLAERSLSDRVKEARIAARSSRKEMQEQEVNLEGQLYGAGIAD